MKKLAVTLAVLAMGVVGIASTAGSADVATILKADTMAGVIVPYTGTTNPIRGVNGGGVPWQIAEAKVVLAADGRLEIKVEGLVLVSTGQNPVGTFRGVVSCQTIVDGAATVRNVQTDQVPATTTGDARIEAVLDLPDPCFAPIVFVTSGGGNWFSVTGV